MVEGVQQEKTPDETTLRQCVRCLKLKFSHNTRPLQRRCCYYNVMVCLYMLAQHTMRKIDKQAKTLLLH